MVFKVCVKFHENVLKDFKVIEPTRKLLTHKGHSKSKKTRVTVHVFSRLPYGV